MYLKNDAFVNISFSTDNLDCYFIRLTIKEHLGNSLCNFKGNILDIGCGKMPYKDFILENSSVENYIGLDIENGFEYSANVKPHYRWDGIKMPFADNSFETTFATEVLEHCPHPKVVLDETYRVMKQGGCFFFTVPFLWNLHEVPNDEYRFTPFALERLLKESGFSNVHIKATGGWHASMAQMLGLWVRRSPMSMRQRNFLSWILKPAIKKLIKMDKFTTVEFKEGQMITGLSGVAFK